MKEKTGRPGYETSLSGDMLIEWVDGGLLIYDPWTPRFMTWQLAPGSDLPRPAIPRWRVLDEDGSVAPDRWRRPADRQGLDDAEYADEEDFGDDCGAGLAGGSPHACSPAVAEAARAAFARHLEAIPDAVRAAVAPLGCFQWHALVALSRVPALVGMLDPRRPFRDRLPVLLCWALAGDDHARPRLGPWIDRQIAAGEARTVMRRFADCRNAGWFAAHAPRIRLDSPDPSEMRDAFWNLRSLADDAEPRVRRIGASLRDLGPETLRYLADARDELVHAGTALALAAVDRADARKLLAFLIDDPWPTTWEDMSRIGEALRAVRGPAHLHRTIGRWQRRLSERAFPQPPFPGSPLLVALATGGALHAEGREMDHCAASHVGSVMDGEDYFYAWHGPERATLRLARDARGRWCLGEVRGISNADVSLDTVRAMLAELEPPAGEARQGLAVAA